MGGFNNVCVSILLRNNDATRNATDNFRHMKELLKLPSCSTSKRSNSLRFVYDKISVHICGLSSLGVASDQYGGLLIPVIMWPMKFVLESLEDEKSWLENWLRTDGRNQARSWSKRS